MWRNVVAFLLVVALVRASSEEHEPDGTCNQDSCVECLDESGLCRRCVYVIMEGSRECRSRCPDGYNVTVGTGDMYRGKMCVAVHRLGLTGKQLAIIAGLSSGGAICVGVLIGSFLFLKQKRKQDVFSRGELESVRGSGTRRGGKVMDPEQQTADRRRFLQHLQRLRPDNQLFVEMLTETRNKFRRFGGTESRADSKAKAYRAVLRDLSRVLSLLTRKEDHIRTLPPDWERLLGWAERVLKRYKRQRSAKTDTEPQSLEFLPAPKRPLNGILYLRNDDRRFSITPVILEESETDPPDGSESVVNAAAAAAEEAAGPPDYAVAVKKRQMVDEAVQSESTMIDSHTQTAPERVASQRAVKSVVASSPATLQSSVVLTKSAAVGTTQVSHREDTSVSVSAAPVLIKTIIPDYSSKISNLPKSSATKTVDSITITKSNGLTFTPKPVDMILSPKTLTEVYSSKSTTPPHSGLKTASKAVSSASVGVLPETTVKTPAPSFSENSLPSVPASKSSVLLSVSKTVVPVSASRSTVSVAQQRTVSSSVNPVQTVMRFPVNDSTGPVPSHLAATQNMAPSISRVETDSSVKSTRIPAPVLPKPPIPQTKPVISTLPGAPQKKKPPAVPKKPAFALRPGHVRRPPGGVGSDLTPDLVRELKTVELKRTQPVSRVAPPPRIRIKSNSSDASPPLPVVDDPCESDSGVESGNGVADPHGSPTFTSLPVMDNTIHSGHIENFLKAIQEEIVTEL